MDFVLGERLRAERTKRGLTQWDVVRALGLGSDVVLSRYENGTRMPDFQTLMKLADYYGVTVDYLLGRTADPTFEDEMPEDVKVLFRKIGKLSEEDRRQVVNTIKWLHAKIDWEEDVKKPQ